MNLHHSLLALLVLSLAGCPAANDDDSGIDDDDTATDDDDTATDDDDSVADDDDSVADDDDTVGDDDDSVVDDDDDTTADPTAALYGDWTVEEMGGSGSCSQIGWDRYSLSNLWFAPTTLKGWDFAASWWNAPEGPTNCSWVDANQTDWTCQPLSEAFVPDPQTGGTLTVTWTLGGSAVSSGGSLELTLEMTRSCDADCGGFEPAGSCDFFWILPALPQLPG